jgi:hypothetical protein
MFLISHIIVPVSIWLNRRSSVYEKWQYGLNSGVLIVKRLIIKANVADIVDRLSRF